MLVDAGISGKQIAAGLAAVGLELTDLNAILITHEHTDHIRSLRTVCKASGACVYASLGTFGGMEFERELPRKEIFHPGDVFEIGDILVRSFPTSHDAADPCGFSFIAAGRQISIVTDTGTVTDTCFECIKTADILVLESNHDESMLRIGRYPWFLKQRILSDRGHLSNEAAAEAMLRALQLEKAEGRSKQRLVLLAHLSRENNFPEMAVETMKNVLASGGFVSGSDIRVEVLSRTEQSPLFIL